MDANEVTTGRSASGSYEFATVGTHTIRAVATQGSATAEGRTSVTVDEAGPPEIDLSATPASGAGRLETVLQATGVAASGVSIDSVWVDANADGQRRSDEVKSGRTNVTTATFRNDSDATMTRVVTAGAFQSDGQRAETTIDLTIEPWRTYSGVILDSDRSPIEGARIESADTFAVAAEDGSFELPFDGDVEEIVISASGFQDRRTFTVYGEEYILIRNGRLDQVDHVLRWQSGLDEPRPTRRWVVQPEKVRISTSTISEEGVKRIIDFVQSGDFERMTGGWIKSVTDGQIELVRESTGNLDRVIAYTGRGARTVQDAVYDDPETRTRIRGMLVGVGADGSRGAIIHETGHGFGHRSHPFEDSDAWNNDVMGVGNEITRFTIRNGRILYDRPAGNERPDDDPVPSTFASAARTNIWNVDLGDDRPTLTIEDPMDGVRGMVNGLEATSWRP